jgi:predicted nucleotidyltransferase
MAFDWSLYKGNLTWLRERTHYLTRHGSWAYGTNTPESDEDFRGIAIAPREFYFGAMHKFEQAVCNDPDLTIFEARKFVSLASQANPNVLEILFVEPSDQLQVSPLGERLLSMRELFITKRVRHTFSGYAASQMSRIKRHFSWLKHPPAAKPERKDFGLPEHTLVPTDHLKAAQAAIQGKLDRWSADYLDGVEPDARIAITNRFAEHLAELQVASVDDLWPAAARTLGMSDNLIEAMKRERAYEGAKREWTNYETWKKTRNPKRAELEALHGYDTKHAMHLVRLLRMCREILTTGKVIVKRPDAAELLEIRRGAWAYEELVEWSERQDAELQVIAAESKLPKAPDIERIDRELVAIVEDGLR